MVRGERVSMYPYKDSALWFCAANRVNWDYEYAWFWDLSDKAVVMRPKTGKPKAAKMDYPLPEVFPIALSVENPSLVPVRHRWGEKLGKANEDDPPAPLSRDALQRVRKAVRLSLPAEMA